MRGNRERLEPARDHAIVCGKLRLVRSGCRADCRRALCGDERQDLRPAMRRVVAHDIIRAPARRRQGWP
eukprot:7167200-Prymnesium_polylepis.1